MKVSKPSGRSNNSRRETKPLRLPLLAERAGDGVAQCRQLGDTKLDAADVSSAELRIPLPARCRQHPGGHGEPFPFPSTARPLRAAAFTLVELLTVIAVIAVLASLLMTAVASARKKSRATVCLFNLHQISLALDMYLDDFAKRPPDVDNLVSGNFLPSPRSLLCPEDKTGNWGRLVRATQIGSSLLIDAPTGGTPSSASEPVKYSYLLHPLSWDDVAWDRLMQAGGSAGVAACQLHGLGNQNVPDLHSYSGLLLRAQRDGAVVRRRIFWTTEAFASGVAATPMSIPFSVPDQYPLQIYLDDPAHWIQASP